MSRGEQGNTAEQDEGRQVPRDDAAEQRARDEAIETLPPDAAQATSEAGQGANASVDQLQQQLADAQQEVLRAHAELDNFRKRLRRETEEQLKYAHLPIMRDLIGVLDNLQRAVEAAKHDQATLESLRSGVEMVIQQFVGVLAKYGCEGIEAVGRDFDPNVHEAIGHQPSDEVEAGKVIHEVAPGYRLHDRVVRPSNVIVSAGPNNAGETGGKENS
ncbi:MAG: protein GrpE [Pirellulaceae bacterium]|nr:MAG: protein GrpE [Pirellulaceae bacterium]